MRNYLILLLLHLMIPLQVQDGIPKFEFFTKRPKFSSTLLPRDNSESESVVTEAPEIQEET